MSVVDVAAANFLIGWRNHVLYREDAEISLDPGEIAEGSLGALRTIPLSERVTLTASTPGEGAATIRLFWEVDDAAAVAVQLIGLLNYSLVATGATGVSMYVSFARVEGGTTEEDPVVVWQRPSDDFPSHALKILDEAIPDAYIVRVTVSASFGEGGGTLFFTPGQLWIGPVVAYPLGIEGGWREAVEDTGEMKTSRGLQGYPRRGRRRRIWRGKATGMERLYAYGDDDVPEVLDVQQLLYRVGTTEPVMLFPRTRWAGTGPRSTHAIHRLGSYGHFRSTGEIAHVKGNEFDWTGAEHAELL